MNAQRCLQYCRDYSDAVPDMRTARNIVEWLADKALTIAETVEDRAAIDNLRARAIMICDLDAAERLVGQLDQVWRNCLAMSPYADDREAFKAHERGEAWPAYLEMAYTAHRDAVARHSLLRFGPDGVLGATKHSPLNDQPLATPGLTSYRAKGRYGWCMIGAKDHADAMREARRMTDNPTDLQIWCNDKKSYIPVDSA